MKIENEKSAIPSSYEAPIVSGKYKFVFDDEVIGEFECREDFASIVNQGDDGYFSA